MFSVSPADTANYICQLSGYLTCEKRNLSLHEQAVHEGKQFQCPDCKYQANRKDSLVAHQKSAQYQASYRSSLVQHKNSAHMGQSFQCQECEYKATRKHHLVRHTKTVQKC